MAVRGTGEGGFLLKGHSFLSWISRHGSFIHLLIILGLLDTIKLVFRENSP